MTVVYIDDVCVELLDKPKARRGTSNKNSAGSSEDRRKRKLWLIETFRADVDLWKPIPAFPAYEIPAGTRSGEEVQKCCRCYRCGFLLTILTVTVDRIVPGCQGGTYRRNNIRPSCQPCASFTGGVLGASRRNAKS